MGIGCSGRNTRSAAKAFFRLLLKSLLPFCGFFPGLIPQHMKKPAKAAGFTCGHSGKKIFELNENNSSL